MVDSPEVTQLFGSIQHVGYVVTDLDTTIAAWRRAAGIGPFVVFRRMNPFRNLRYRGELSDDVVISVALARSGPLQIELIQQHNDTPSIYTEALAGHDRGPHHYGFFTKEYDRASEHARQVGMRAIVETGVPGAPRMTYFSYSGIDGFIAELIEMGPAVRANHERVAAMLGDADPAVTTIESGE